MSYVFRLAETDMMPCLHVSKPLVVRQMLLHAFRLGRAGRNRVDADIVLAVRDRHRTRQREHAPFGGRVTGLRRSDQRDDRSRIDY